MGLAALSNLTENQLLFWIGYKLEPDIPLETHCIRFVFTIDGHVDPIHFQKAFQNVIDRSDTLRTVIREIDMVPTRQVAPRLTYTVEHVRFSDRADPEAAFRDWADERRRRPLGVEAPFESVLFQLSPLRFIWCLALHHLIGDAHSVHLIVRHVSQVYQLSLEGKLDSAPPLPPLPPFEDYVAYDRAHRSSEAHAKAAAYWAKKVPSGRPTRQQRTPPPDGSRLESLRTEHFSRPLDVDTSMGLTALARREGLFSPAVVFLTALYLQLARLRGSGQPLAIGSTFLNRPERFSDTIGLFVSTCPLVVQLDEDEDTLLSLARKVQMETIQVSTHQNYPVQNPAHGRIFEAFFNYLNVQFPKFANLDTRTYRIRSGYSNNAFGLAVNDFQGTGAFTLDFEFQCRTFDADACAEAMAFYLEVLDAFRVDPNRKVSTLL